MYPLHYANESSFPTHSAFKSLGMLTPTTPAQRPSIIPSELSANDYFQKKNIQLIREVQEYALLTCHLKKENGILKAKVNSLQKLVDDMTGSNRSLRKLLKKKEQQLKELKSTPPKPVPSSPQVLVNASGV